MSLQEQFKELYRAVAEEIGELRSEIDELRSQRNQAERRVRVYEEQMHQMELDHGQFLERIESCSQADPDPYGYYGFSNEERWRVMLDFIRDGVLV